MAASVWNLIIMLSVTGLLVLALQDTLRPTSMTLLLISAVVMIALITLLAIFGPKFWKCYTQSREKFDTSAFGVPKSLLELSSSGGQSGTSDSSSEPVHSEFN